MEEGGFVEGVVLSVAEHVGWDSFLDDNFFVLHDGFYRHEFQLGVVIGLGIGFCLAVAPEWLLGLHAFADNFNFNIITKTIENFHSIIIMS